MLVEKLKNNRKNQKSLPRSDFSKSTTGGFSLVELLVGVAVFSVICVSVYSSYVSIFGVIHTSRSRLDAVDLANEQFEIIRNLPYGDVGIYGMIYNSR